MLKPMIDIPLASLRAPPRLCPDDQKRLTRSRRRSAMGETRKRAAIFAADVVGYSCLMGEDEAGTALSAIIAAHLCADRFDEELEDQVVARLANTLGIELVKAEAEKGARSKNPDAVDLTMRGWALARTSCATTSRHPDLPAR